MSEFRLLTPVANAYEAYRRRLAADKSSHYEHVWRLIHIHESIVVTIGILIATKLLHDWESDPQRELEANLLRKKITGLAIPDSGANDSELPNSSACLDGYINPWINLLKEYSSQIGLTNSKYFDATSQYLTHSPEKNLAFIGAWGKISEVPRIYSGEQSKPNRVTRFEAINSLRNKLAHVPIPQKILEELHFGIRQEVLSLLSPEYNFEKDYGFPDFDPRKWHPPLFGKIITKNSFLTGSIFGSLKAKQTVDKPGTISIETNTNEVWNIFPFIRVDPELKLSLLFKVDDLRGDPGAEEFKAEYHRFAAEFLPVQKDVINKSFIVPWIPATPVRPKMDIQNNSTTNSPLDFPSSNDSPKDLRGQADSAFKSRDYQSAISLYRELSKTEDRDFYNEVAKGLFGGSLWREAESNASKRTSTERQAMIEESIELLDLAARHKDPSRQARAQYEKSKAYWHKWKITNTPDCLQQALNAAEIAATTGTESSYISWHEKVSDDCRFINKSLASIAVT